MYSVNTGGANDGNSSGEEEANTETQIRCGVRTGPTHAAPGHARVRMASSVRPAVSVPPMSAPPPRAVSSAEFVTKHAGQQEEQFKAAELAKRVAFLERELELSRQSGAVAASAAGSGTGEKERPRNARRTRWPSSSRPRDLQPRAGISGPCATDH